MLTILKALLVISPLMAEVVTQETDFDYRYSTVSEMHVEQSTGSSVDISEVPFQVSVNVYGRHVCGGSILNAQMVLTALHCTMWGVISDIQIRAGTSNPYKGGQEVAVKGICTYANKDELDPYKDIQILLLDKSLVFGAHIQPIQLSFIDISNDSTVLITGWNLIDSTSEKKLRKVFLSKKSNDLCPGYQNDNSLACFTSNSLEKLSNVLVKTGGPLIVNGKQVALDAYSYRNPCDNNRGLYIMLKPHRSFINKCTAHYSF